MNENQRKVKERLDNVFGVKKENQIDVSEIIRETPPPTSVELPTAAEKVVVNFDELKPNSVVVIKIAATGMQQRFAASQQIAMALRPLTPLAKEKGIVFILMGTNESIETVDEDSMRELGWVKKDPSLIIVP